MPDLEEKNCIDYLSKCKNFKFEHIIGKGSYGVVVKIIDNTKIEKAAKIIQKKQLNDLEMTEWPNFDHENVLKLLETIIDVEGFTVFVTNLMNATLFYRLQDDRFKKCQFATDKCLSYAQQVCSGISYIHQKGLCHMDLRAENILLDADDRAVVADFSGLCWESKLRKSIPLPNSLRPPELIIENIKVEPKPVDLWSCGLIIANLFLGKGYYTLTVRNSASGSMQAVLQYTKQFKSYHYVKKSISDTYPNSKMDPIRLQQLIVLMRKFLRLEPHRRITVEAALKQHFFDEHLVESHISVPSPSSSIGSSVTEKSEVSNKLNTEMHFVEDYFETGKEQQKRKGSRKRKMTLKPLRRFLIGNYLRFHKRVSEVRDEKTSKNEENQM